MSKKKITIIDYGMGNIASLKNAFTYLGAEVVVTDDPEKIKNSNYVILPGVGSFKRAMEQIKRRNIDDAIIETAKKGNYIFGICLGMQLMGASSTEDSYTKGIGLIDNEVIRRFKRWFRFLFCSLFLHVTKKFKMSNIYLLLWNKFFIIFS